MFISKQYQSMKWVLKLSTSLSIISDLNWENLKHNKLQPNLPLYLYKKKSVDHERLQFNNCYGLPIFFQSLIILTKNVHK